MIGKIVRSLKTLLNPQKLLSLFLIVSFALTATALFTTQAKAASCPEFPKVVWWETSHEKVVSYVSRKHDGDWLPYVAKWNSQLAKMKDIQKRGGSAVLKSKDLKLSGDILKQYINAIADRLAITTCLAINRMAYVRDDPIG